MNGNVSTLLKRLNRALLPPPLSFTDDTFVAVLSTKAE